MYVKKIFFSIALFSLCLFSAPSISSAQQDFISIQNENKADSLMLLGDSFLDHENYTEALSCYSQALLLYGNVKNVEKLRLA